MAEALEQFFFLKSLDTSRHKRRESRLDLGTTPQAAMHIFTQSISVAHCYLQSR